MNLPPEIQPSRDLWAGIEARLDPPARDWRPVALAAAALLVALIGWWSQPPAPPASLVASVPAWEADLQASAAALEAELDARRHELDPTSVAILEENLALIDAAIAECRAALDDSEDADQALIAAYEIKIATLRGVL